MKAFLSYSLTDNDQFVIPLVTQKLQNKGFFVTNGSYKVGNEIDVHTLNEINTSSLFIGIITNTANANQRVYKEWWHSSNRRIPSFLLVEDTYNLNPSLNLENHPNLIRFNRNYPERAIDTIKLQINKSKANNNSKLDEAVPWLLGGAALIALVALLSSD
ncbi:MAG: hypothetical protein AB8E82_16645 [Aureispira sp.]